MNLYDIKMFVVSILFTGISGGLIILSTYLLRMVTEDFFIMFVFMFCLIEIVVLVMAGVFGGVKTRNV